MARPLFSLAQSGARVFKPPRVLPWEPENQNVAPAIVLGTVMVVISLVVAPGLETALDGLLPLPTLARDEVVAPS